jgi:putative effector of murein hydrolase
MSYGPFSYLLSLAFGFVMGVVGFLTWGAIHDRYADIDPMPIFVVWAGVPAAVLLVATAIANYFIGRRIIEELELQRSPFSANGF